MDPVGEFGGKSKEKKLVDRMKNKFVLIKKSRGYSILSITYKAMQFSTQILAFKVMRKCHTNKVSAIVISLVAQCTKWVKYNWA